MKNGTVWNLLSSVLLHMNERWTAYICDIVEMQFSSLNPQLMLRLIQFRDLLKYYNVYCIQKTNAHNISNKNLSYFLKHCTVIGLIEFKKMWGEGNISNVKIFDKTGSRQCKVIKVNQDIVFKYLTSTFYSFRMTHFFIYSTGWLNSLFTQSYDCACAHWQS